MGPLDFEQLANAGKVLASVAFGEEAVVPDAVKAVGQDVEEKTTDELVRGKAHDAAAPAAAIILVGERHFIFVDGDEPRIGDRGAMGVAGEIGKHSLGSAERRLGVDDEGALAQRAHALGESGGLGERGQIAEEAEFAATERRLPSRRGTGGGRSSTGRGRRAGSWVCRRPIAGRRGRRRRRGRDNGHGGDGSASAPRCATRR